MNHFEEQLKVGNPISEEVLPELGGKYYSGREYAVNDIVLYGLLEIDEETNQIMTLHKDEISDYEIIYENCIEDNIIPYLRKR